MIQFHLIVQWDKLQQVADALNGAQEANNCNVHPSSLKGVIEEKGNLTLSDIEDITDLDNYIFVDYMIILLD